MAASYFYTRRPGPGDFLHPDRSDHEAASSNEKHLCFMGLIMRRLSDRMDLPMEAFWQKCFSLFQVAVPRLG